MNEIFKTLKDKFPFLSLIKKGDMEFVGIVQNQDNNVISFYDYGRLMQPQDKMRYLKCGEIWWYESNRKLPINIFLKGDFRYFRTTLVTLNSKDVEIVEGPTVRLSNISKKRVKRRTIQLVRKPTLLPFFSQFFYCNISSTDCLVDNQKVLNDGWRVVSYVF